MNDTQSTKPPRKVFVGKNSRLFLNYSSSLLNNGDIAISHAELRDFSFESGDILIVLSYSKRVRENQELLDSLSGKGKQVILISTVSAVVANYTSCYKYPKIKLNMEKYAIRNIKNLLILRIGTIVNCANADFGYCVLPVVEFKAWLDNVHRIDTKGNKMYTLYECYEFKEKSLESKFYNIYIAAIKKLPYPCILRPLDLIIKKIMGYKWYGYGALSKIFMENANV